MMIITLIVPVYSEKKRKEKKYHTDGTISKSNIKILERGTIDTPNTQIYDHFLSWLGTGISI